MSTSTPVKEQKSKVHFKQYLRSEDEKTEETKPAEEHKEGEATQPATS